MASTSLGKAYVQIIPSAEGIKGSIEKVLNQESSSAGKKAGSNIVSAIKGFIVAGGITTALKTSISLGADLEQNLGGTEAVFGEFALNIQKSADEAYRNMGLSASDYMSTANKMASLFQGAGISQEKSLSLTSDAMQRAADVASVMGIDTKSAMESIAAAAKGNFTMMDNLGVAMNATTLKAYALEKGINFDWNTANNAEKAELAMKMFMERTSQYSGNFAKESEKTLAGSYSAMSTSLKNFLANLSLGRDIEPSLKALAKTTVTFFGKNLLPAIFNIIKKLPEGIAIILKELIPEIVNFGKDLIKNISTAITNNSSNIYNSMLNVISSIKNAIINEIPNIYSQGVEIISNLANGFFDNIPQMINLAAQVINELLSAFLISLPQIMESGFQLFKNLAQGMLNNLPEISMAVLSAISTITSTLLENLPMILEKGIEIMMELVAGMFSSLPQIGEQILELGGKVIDEFAKVEWLKIGGQIVDGLIQGLQNGLQKALNAVGDFCGDILDGAKDFFGIHSPSREFAYIGRMNMEGFAKGITDNKRQVKKAMEDVSGMFTDDFSSNLKINTSNISNGSSSFNKQPKETFCQNITINSPTELSPSEIARKTRIATQNLVLGIDL